MKKWLKVFLLEFLSICSLAIQYIKIVFLDKNKFNRVAKMFGGNKIVVEIILIHNNNHKNKIRLITI